MGWRKYTSICGNGKAFRALIRELGQKTMAYRGEAFRCSCNERIIFLSLSMLISKYFNHYF